LATQYFCHKPRRRAEVLTTLDGQGHPVLNGIDYLEVSAAAQTQLQVHFLFDLPGAPSANPQVLAPANIRIEGGTRITGIHAVSVSAAGKVLSVTVSAAGDFSTYTLRLLTTSGYDPQLSAVDFSFKAGCPSDFDCRTTDVCPPEDQASPAIDYLAKDYASFRRLILDRMAVTMPAWRESSPADIGITLVELLAYAGDQLSYYQDAVGTEAYLGTARRRISVRRHARLLDYRLHEGVNARAWVHFEAGPSGAKIDPQTALLTQANSPRGPLVDTLIPEALVQGSLVFQTLAGALVHPELNRIRFYTWSDDQCCLPQGAVRATLIDEGAGPLLSPGDAVLFEEVLGPATGAAADADPAHRHVVRLTEVSTGSDPLNNTGLVEIAWDAADALPFGLCLSAAIDSGAGAHVVSDVSVARGNLILADHGQTQPLENLPTPADTAGFYRPKLQNAGLTFHVAYDDFVARQSPAAGSLLQDVRAALPDITVEEGAVIWHPRHDLLGSGRNATDFVVEVENEGLASLRFGDGIMGAKPASGMAALYRTGNGAAGNVGAESIAHIVYPENTNAPDVLNVRNPLAAQGGKEAETLDQVRRFAPWAFRTQERAVTEADYSEVARRMPEVKQAQATLRWTGSWYTVFVAVDRENGLPVDAAFRTRVRDFLERFRLAGYDLEIASPLFVPLDILFTICVAPGYFRAAVKSALLEVFSNRALAAGGRGFFHPDNFTFGQSVFLSQMVAAAMAVPGVRWVDTSDLPPKPNRFKRFGRPSDGEAAAGRISMEPNEIARLDNDPSDPENGRIQFIMEGGI
jgi:hypothetical protein